MSQFTGKAGVGETFSIKIVRDSTCPDGDQCLAAQLKRGLAAHRVIRSGDLVSCADHEYTVKEVTTDYGPHLGRFSIRGTPRRLAAALLVLEDAEGTMTTKYVDHEVAKLCPSCKCEVIRFDA